MAMGWGLTNRIKTAALTASTEAAGLGVGNIQSDRGAPSAAWQTTTTSGYLLADAGLAVTWRAFGIFRTNLTQAATARWRVGSVASMSSGVVWDSGTVDGIVPGFAQQVTIAPADATARYCRLDLADAANPDGFLNIPLCYAGPLWIPAKAPSPESAQGRDAAIDEIRTRGGQEYPVARWQARRWDLVFAYLLGSEMPSAHELDMAGRAGGNVLLVPDLAGDMGREPIFGRSAALGDFSFPYVVANARGWRVRVTERL